MCLFVNIRLNNMFSATLPGMWDRTVTIGSAGKTFSVTGWKVGWAVGPANLIQGIKTIHDAVLRTNPTPTQVCTKFIELRVFCPLLTKKLLAWVISS